MARYTLVYGLRLIPEGSLKGLAQKYGERFKPNKLLIEMAQKGESFYSRFAPKQKKAA